MEKIYVTILQVNWKATYIFIYMLKIVHTKSTHCAFI